MTISTMTCSMMTFGITFSLMTINRGAVVAQQ
jgi:hypothetical protein